jgi:hypothetical protein
MKQLKNQLTQLYCNISKFRPQKLSVGGQDLVKTNTIKQLEIK